MGIFETIVSSGKKAVMAQGLDTILGNEAKFQGEVFSAGSLSIGGQFEGKINAVGEVLVLDGGRVTGEINGGKVIVAGRVDGNINAKEILEVKATGRIHGDLTGGKIVIDEGSFYQGRVRVEGGQAEAADNLATEPVEENRPAF